MDVLTSSMSAQIVNVPQFQASYHPSKAGVSMLTQALVIEWAPRAVRVNAIAPRHMLPEMTRRFSDANPDLARQWTGAIPMGRMGRPEDLRGLVGFPASDAPAHLTSQTIVIDGGYTAVQRHEARRLARRCRPRVVAVWPIHQTMDENRLRRCLVTCVGRLPAAETC